MLGIKKLPNLDKRLTSLEHIFKAPPLTSDLVATIKLISPQLDLTLSERSRTIWEADQNGVSWGEYEALEQLLNSMPTPKKILEIGPGLGRSIVFLNKKRGWEKSEIHAYEGEGTSTKYTMLGPRFEDSFCGNIKMLSHVLEFNNINNFKIFNARYNKLTHLPGPYDFIYGFYSIGFHWALNHFLDDILHLMHETSVAVFTVPNEFKPFPELKSLSYKIIKWKTVWPKDFTLKLLIISKKSIPSIFSVSKK